VIVVIGCGNPNRRDDGAGVEVVRLLEARGAGRDSQNVRLLDTGTDGMAAMFAARGCRTLIIVDASRSGSEPGAIFEVPGSDLELRYEPSLNLHDFRWDHALFAGKKIFREDFPSDVVVLLIEVRSLELGIGLSPAISAAVAKVADRVERLIQSRTVSASGCIVTVASITLTRGALYLSHDTYDRYFAGLETVVLLRRDRDLCILPVRHAAAGGYLLKLRNKAGDRVVHAPDFFREYGIDENIALELSVVWSTERGALVAADTFEL
jgi:hydrogenase maturation protease